MFRWTSAVAPKGPARRCDVVGLKWAVGLTFEDAAGASRQSRGHCSEQREQEVFCGKRA